MERLNFKLECLWGTYQFTAELKDDGLAYCSSSDIEGFTPKEGTLDDPQAFLDLIGEAQIEKWDREYGGDNGIEDAVRWSAELKKDGHVYHSHGEEPFWPYGYEKLIEAIRLADGDISRF